jgi:hypothetical protein
LGGFSPKGDADKGDKGRFDGATIILDPKNIAESKEEPAVTMAHELGHAKAAKDDYKQYSKDVQTDRAKAEQKQAEPYEKAVREELKQQKPPEEKKK